MIIVVLHVSQNKLDHFLLDLSGGQFKVFVPISSDVAFAAYAGVVVALLLLSIALLGHLLGFHIYLSKCLACTLYLVPQEYSSLALLD